MRSKHFTNETNTPCSCDWVQERLCGYLDGELPLSERERFQVHTETCSACAREVQNARRADLALHQAISTVPAAGDLRSGFYAKLAQSEAKPRASRRWGWVVAAPAFAACAIAVVLMRPTTPVSNPAESLPVKNSIAVLPPSSEKKDAAASVISDSVINDDAPPPIVAESALLRAERLNLANVTLSIHLTKRELRRASKSAIVRVNAPIKALSSANFSREERRANTSRFGMRRGFASSEERLSPETKSFADLSLLRSESAAKLNEVAGVIAAEIAAEYNEPSQNVMRVASLEQTETDGESYLEVDDDTRNFSFSTRLVSSQENGEEEIELSVSGDDPAENPDSTDSE